MKSNIIKFEYCVFNKSTKIGIFDKDKSVTEFEFDFIKFSKPKANYLIENDVAEVVQSWKKEGNRKFKTLHSGLFNLGNGIYVGNNINQNGKKDFLLLKYVKDKQQIHFFLVKNRNPKNINHFVIELLESIKNLNLF